MFPEPMKAWRLGRSRSRRRRGTSRWPGRFYRMLSNRILWPGMIGIVLAVGLGVQIGESAVGSINPIHFQGAAARPQGIDPNVQPPAQSAYAQAYGWEQGNAARVVDSGFQDFNYIPQPISVQRVAEPVWHDTPPAMTPWPPGQVSSHPDVERYIDYPIEEKPVARQAEPEPEQSVPEQSDASALSPTGK